MKWTQQHPNVLSREATRKCHVAFLMLCLLAFPQLAFSQSKPSFGTFRSEDGWIVKLEGEPGGSLEGVAIRPNAWRAELEPLLIQADNIRPRELVISYPLEQDANQVVEYRRVDNLTEIINGNRLVYTRYRAIEEESNLPNELFALIQASDVADESPAESDFATSSTLSLLDVQAILAAQNEARADYFGRDSKPDNSNESLILVADRDLATTLQAELPQDVRAQLRFYTKGQNKTLISAPAASISFVASQSQSAGIVRISGDAFDRVFDAARFLVKGKSPTFLKQFQADNRDPSEKLRALFKIVGAECDSRLDEQVGNVKIICDYHSSDFPLAGSFSVNSKYWVRIGILLSPMDDSLVRGVVHSMEIFNATKEKREIAKKELQASKGDLINPGNHRAFWAHFKDVLEGMLNSEAQGEKS